MASASSRELQSEIDNVQRLIGLNDTFKDTLNSLKTAFKEDEKVFDKPIQALTTQSEKLTNDIKTKKEALKNITSLKDSHSFNYQLPKFGNFNDLKADTILTFCTPFSGHDSESFETFYRKVQIYAENHELSEKAFRNLISGLLKGGAFDLYYSIRNESLNSILKSLASRYSDHKSIFEYARQLRNLERAENEPISSIMNKVDYLLEKTKNLCSPTEQSARHKLSLIENLYKHASPSAKQKLIEKRFELSRQGIIMSYSEMLELVSLTESSDAPLPHFTINTSTTEPLATPAYIEKRREHRLRSNSPYHIHRQPREKASNTFTPQKFEHSPPANSQPSFEPSQFSNPPPRSRSPPFVPPPSPPIERKSILKGSNNHFDSGEQYHNRAPYNQRSRSYSPFPSHYDDRRPYYNNLQADDLKLLINRLTDIFNIINKPKRNRSHHYRN